MLWLAYNPNDLTLAFEYDTSDIRQDEILGASCCLLITNLLTSLPQPYATLMKTMELLTCVLMLTDLHLLFLFSITDNFGLNVEYSHSEVDSISGRISTARRILH